MRTLNGVQTVQNQRYLDKQQSVQCSFLSGYCSNLGQDQGYQSKGLLEFMSRLVCKISYAEVSLLLADVIRQDIYTGNQIQQKIVALRPVVERFELAQSQGTQLCFNFVSQEIDLYSPTDKEVLYFDDAVGVTKQKEKRDDVSYSKPTRYVQTDNVVIERATGDFEFLSANKKVENSVAIDTKINLFLSREQQGKLIPLVCIIDGARSIRNRVQQLFGQKVTVILDWYHLDKKVWQYFSRLGQTKADKQRHAEQVLHYLWHGWVQEALIYTEQEMRVPMTKQALLEELQQYISKHKTSIIDYDTRYRIAKKCIGSGRGEKANDQIIAKRQKHNATSWSEDGSAAIAQLRCLTLNNRWLKFWKAA